MAGRVAVFILSMAGLALAYKPPATILQIATQTFTGLAVLFPSVLFGLYLRRVFALSAVLSIAAGEAAVVCFYFKWLPSGGFLPVVWVMLAAFSTYLVPHILLDLKRDPLALRIPQWLRTPYTYLFVGIFLLGIDVWAWGAIEPIFLGIPGWIWYFIGLSALQVVVMLFLVRHETIGVRIKSHSDSNKVFISRGIAPSERN